MTSTSRPGRTVTMKDVAERAGVSISTVSHVVNEKQGARIGADARERVRAAVIELGYRQNLMAKTLVEGTSHFIGLVADSIASTPFAGQIVRGAQEEAWRHGRVLLVANTEGDPDAERDAVAMMLEHKVRGILYSTWNHRATDIPPGLMECDYVLVNCYAPGSSGRAIVPDEADGGRVATQMLLGQGHRRIAFVNTTSQSPAREGRLAGYREALRAAGVEEDPALVLDAQPDQEGGHAVAARVLDTGATAVFCHNDRVAMGLYDALRERGLRVPRDLSVVGFDNQEVIAEHLRPPLSTVALPHYEMGAAGVRVLLGDEQLEAGAFLRIPCPPVIRTSIAVDTKTRNHGASAAATSHPLHR